MPLLIGSAAIAGTIMVAICCGLALLLIGQITSNTETVVAQVEPSVALIEGRLSKGTGFVIRPGIIVTNRHVISAELIEQLQVSFPSANNSGPFTAELLYEDSERDLAFLSVRTSLPPLRIARRHSFRRGEEVIVIGNPGVTDEVVLKNAISRGVMSSEATIDGQDYYQLGISINSGNSGGPVLDSQGQVIGVVTLKAAEKEGLGFCIPLDQLNESATRSDQISQKDIAAIQSHHRLRVVFLRVNVTAAMYTTGMRLYTEAMQNALNNRLSADTGLQTVRGEIQDKLTAFDLAFVSDLEKDATKIGVDPNIPEAIRQRFADLWANYMELKSYVEDPRGNFNTYSAKSNELSDNHNRLSQSLKLLIGVE